MEARVSKLLLIAAIALLLAGALRFWRQDSPVPEEFPFTQTEQQWQASLPEPAYRILRREATEKPGSSPLLEEKRPGRFLCRGCGHVIFLSQDKFDSGTGWPSFVRPAKPEALGSRTDYKLMVPRTEVHCANCGGHLGHVFSDGPPPTGKRFCINGGAMEFKPEPLEESGLPQFREAE